MSHTHCVHTTPGIKSPDATSQSPKTQATQVAELVVLTQSPGAVPQAMASILSEAHASPRVSLGPPEYTRVSPVTLLAPVCPLARASSWCQCQRLTHGRPSVSSKRLLPPNRTFNPHHHRCCTRTTCDAKNKNPPAPIGSLVPTPVITGAAHVPPAGAALVAGVHPLPPAHQLHAAQPGGGLRPPLLHLPVAGGGGERTRGGRRVSVHLRIRTWNLVPWLWSLTRQL